MDIIIKNLSKSFKDNKALDISNFIVRSGEVLGLVGNNGAGKTTLFRCILDLLKSDTGEVVMSGTYAGEQVSHVTSACEDWKSYTGAYVDSGFLVDYLTPEEYFNFVAKICGVSKDSLSASLLKFEHFMNGEVMGQNKLIRNLSAGNQQKVGIIGAMIGNPSVLILDEPFNFLDPSSQIAIKYILEEYNRQTGATILVSSHNLNHTIDICSRITLLEHGSIIKDYDKDYPNLKEEIDAYFSGTPLTEETPAE